MDVIGKGVPGTLSPKEYVVIQADAASINTPSGWNSTTIRIGKVELCEQDVQDLLNIREFVDRLIATDSKAAEIMIAIKARQRILK